MRTFKGEVHAHACCCTPAIHGECRTSPWQPQTTQDDMKQLAQVVILTKVLHDCNLLLLLSSVRQGLCYNLLGVARRACVKAPAKLQPVSCFELRQRFEAGMPWLAIAVYVDGLWCVRACVAVRASLAVFPSCSEPLQLNRSSLSCLIWLSAYCQH